MKLLFTIYLRSLAFYMLLTSPLIVVAIAWFASALAAIIYSAVALAVFGAVFYAVYVARPGVVRAGIILVVAVIPAVLLAYDVCLHTLDLLEDRTIWTMDGFSLFPAAAIIAGWVGLYASRKKVVEHFTRSPLEELENIFS
jgi:hypothetical protein